MEDQNKYMKALGYIALAAIAFGAYKYFADKPKGVSGFDTVSIKKHKGKRRAAAFARMESEGVIYKKNKSGKRKAKSRK